MSFSASFPDFLISLSANFFFLDFVLECVLMKSWIDGKNSVLGYQGPVSPFYCTGDMQDEIRIIQLLGRCIDGAQGKKCTG